MKTLQGHARWPPDGRRRVRSSCWLNWIVASAVGVVLGGCALGTSGPPTPDAGMAITGRVMGAQAPLVGAQVYLLAANTTGYGGAGIAASTSNASVSLLTSGTLDTSGGPTNGFNYVTTDSNGSFSITGDYMCTAGQQVYLYSLGGSQGGVANPVAGLMAALGSCPSGGSFATEIPFVYMNEVSTIAAAYAMAGFATDALHVSSSGTALALVGISNAFANAANLAGIATGAALATTPAGNGTVPQNEINTLANILASCVNTNGAVTGPASATTCYTLFHDAQSGGSSGTVPADTATAAINMAHNPGTNITGLYGLSTGSPPFAPALSMQPNDFTVGIGFTYGFANYPAIAIDAAGDVWLASWSSKSVSELTSAGAIVTGVSYTGGGLNYPYSIAVDGADDLWVTNATNPGESVSELTSAGSFLSGANGFTGGGLYLPQGIAIDGAGDAWITNQTSMMGSILEISSMGSYISGASGYSGSSEVYYPAGIAVDGSGNVWWVNGGGGTGGVGSVARLASSGTFPTGVSTYTGSGIDLPGGVAIDAAGDAWVTNQSGGSGGHGSVTKISNAGTILSGTSGYSGGGLQNPYAIAIDGAGNVWVTSSSGGDVSEFTNAGAALSPATGFTGGGLSSPNGVAIDGSGDVWVINRGSSSLTELIGVGAPVVTPICAGLPATATGNGTSGLGTRP